MRIIVLQAPAKMQKSTRHRWEVVLLLWFAYFLYQADKQIYNVVLPPLRSELGLSGYEAGLVNTLFTIVVAVLSPLAGILGDRYPRQRVVIASIALWSVGTVFTGFSGTFLAVLIARSAITGGAEAFYPPVSHALLAEYHTRTRALAISIHQTAQYAGPVASGYLAGWIAQHFGWRYGFLLFGGAGVMLSALMILRMRNRDAAAHVPAGGWFDGFVHCFRSVAVRRIGLAFACVLFVSIGYSTWAPTIFGTQFGLNLAEAGLQATFWTSVPAMAGALIGGAVSDRLAARGRSRLDLQAAALFGAAPLMWLLGSAGTLSTATLALAGVGLCRGVYEGTIAVTLYDFVRPEHRSSAAAVVLLIANLLAAPSSAMLGWIGDHADLPAAISALSICFVLGSALLLSGRRLPVIAEEEGTEVKTGG